MNRVRAVLAVVVVLSSVLAGVAVAGGDSGQNGTPASGSGASGNWTLEEIERGGQQIGEDANPSKRWLGYDGSAYLSYRETNFIRELGQKEPSYAVDHVAHSGKLVDTNTVTLHVNRKRSAKPRTVHVVVVAADPESRMVERNNATVRERYAANVTTKTMEVSLTGATDTIEVSLPNHPDETHKVLVYIKEYDSARWSFDHQSIATTASLPFGPTWSSFMPWLVSRFVILVGAGAVGAIYLADKTLKEVGPGPGKSMGWWLFMGGLALYMGLYFHFGSFVRFLVTVPVAMALAVDLLVYIAALTYMSDVKQVLFERLLTTEVENPLGEAVPDIETEQGRTVHVMETDEHGVYELVQHDNLKQFIIRALGAEPPRLHVSDLKARVEYYGPFAEKFYASEDEDMVVSITWPHLVTGLDVYRTEDGDLDRDAIRSAAASALLEFGVVMVGARIFFSEVFPLDAGHGGLLPAIFVGLIPVWWEFTETRDGVVEFVPAAVHGTPAKASRVTEKNEYILGDTFESLQENIADLQMESHERAMDITEAYMRRIKRQWDDVLGGSDPVTAGDETTPASGSAATETGVSDD